MGNNICCNEPKLIDTLKNEKICAIAAKNNQSFCITEIGEVYAWGENDCGQLGLGNNVNQNKPQLIEALQGKKIIAIALGNNHTLCLAENGELYSCGRNHEGQLGLGNKEILNKPILVKSLQDKKIVAIAAGNHHSLCLTSKGQVYGFGANHHGQLGLENNENQIIPKLIELKGKKIISIAACSTASLFLTDDHKILSCGDIGGRKTESIIIEIPLKKENASHDVNCKLSS